MKLTVRFLDHSLRIDSDKALSGWFDFSLIDSALVGTPKEEYTTHTIVFRMSRALLTKWELSGNGFEVSEQMTKVAFQKVEEYVSEEIKKNPMLTQDLPALNMTPKDSPESCPYPNLANIPYPEEKTFSVDVETQVSHLKPSESSNDEGASLPLRVFISYSTIDKLIAGDVKAILDKLGLSSFLAHNDIRVSEEWKSRIIEELNGMDVFVALLSKSFKKSDWAAQEVGMALSRKEVLVIPLSVDGTIPFGFMFHIQGKQIATGGISEDSLLEPIIVRFPHKIIPKLIARLANAHGFRNAEALMLPLVPHFAKFNDDEIQQFATASIENGQIWDAGDCRDEYPPAFLRLHRSRMDREALEKLEYQLKHRKWYHLRTDA